MLPAASYTNNNDRNADHTHVIMESWPENRPALGYYRQQTGWTPARWIAATAALWADQLAIQAERDQLRRRLLEALDQLDAGRRPDAIARWVGGDAA